MAQTTTMTREEYVAAQAEYLAKAEEAVSAYNQASDTTAANAAESAAKAAIKSANDCALRVFLLDCIAAGAGTEDATAAAHAVMVKACTDHTYKIHALTVSAAADDVKTATIVPREKVVDLTKFNRAVVSQWFYRAEILTDFLTRDIATGIGYSAQRLNDAMRFFKLSKEAAAAPKVSKSTLKKVVPEIIGAMLGAEYAEKVIAADVNYLLDKFVVGGKSMVVKVASIKQTVGLLADIAHRVLTDGFYTVEGKELKEKKAKAAK